MATGEPGHFLVRDKASNAGSFALTVNAGSELLTYLIETRGVRRRFAIMGILWIGFDFDNPKFIPPQRWKLDVTTPLLPRALPARTPGTYGSCDLTILGSTDIPHPHQMQREQGAAGREEGGVLGVRNSRKTTVRSTRTR